VLRIEPDSRRRLTSSGQIPIGLAAPLLHYPSPRFRALALFGRRSAERVVRSSLPASENLTKSGCEQSQQKGSFNYLISPQQK
jgi:hypothetical protein